MRHTTLSLTVTLLSACTAQPSTVDGSFGQDTAFVGGGEGGLDAPRDSPDTGPLTDGEIVGVLLAIHRGDLATSEYVIANTVRDDVRAFASDLHARQITAESDVVAAASAAGVTSVESSISIRQASLRMQLLQQMMDVGCTGQDASYLGLQALFSNEALGIVDANLLPAVSAALRPQVENARALLETEASGLPVVDGSFPEAAVPIWESGASFDSGCPTYDAYIDVGPDS